MVLPQRIIAILEEAEVWLMSAQASNLPCQEELIYRIQLRKTLLRLFALELPRKTPFIFPLIAEARRLLDNIKRRPINPPMEGSSAYAAFDSRITRQLNSIIPIRPLTLPPQEEAWKAVEGLLDGWELIYLLSGCESLLAWNVRYTVTNIRILFITILCRLDNRATQCKQPTTDSDPFTLY
ncbi:hypothetical protein M0805_001010 [Coniferiporia weirii]|nr:hypothetical protein M0805_001010 [Coniferiporia weirii]